MAQVIVEDEAFKLDLEKYVDKTMPDAIDNGLVEVCKLILRDATRKCPVDDGELQGSLTMDIDKQQHVGYVGTNCEYAPYVEIGTGIYSSKGDGRKDVPWHYQDAEGNWHTTSGNKPKPFLQPALDENKARIIEVMKDAFKSN